jgi:signal transduction histidine kinase
MAELIAGIVSDTQFEAQAHGKQLVFSGACAVCVRGDPELIRQAIENVVRNSLKHTAQGDAVILEVSIVGAELKLTILDSGPGVPESELPHIFKPFYRGSGNSYNADGHGLGLAISRRIFNNAGGSISASNRKEGGFCVGITLPLFYSHSAATSSLT